MLNQTVSHRCVSLELAFHVTISLLSLSTAYWLYTIRTDVVPQSRRWQLPIPAIKLWYLDTNLRKQSLIPDSITWFLMRCTSCVQSLACPNEIFLEQIARHRADVLGEMIVTIQKQRLPSTIFWYAICAKISARYPSLVNLECVYLPAYATQKSQ